MSPDAPFWQVYRAWFSARPLRSISIILGVLVAIVYSGMPAEELTFDSAYIIGEDTRLTGFSAESFKEVFKENYWWPSLQSNLYRPLTTLGFMVESSFLGFGKKPAGYQIDDALLHWLNGLLLFLVARRLLKSGTMAFLVSTVYVVHPLATEAVANIVGRSDLMATTGVLAGVWCYFRALDEPDRMRRIRYLLYCGACGMAGVLSKESAIVLPAIIGLHGLLRLPELRERTESRQRWLQDAFWAALALLPAAMVFLASRVSYSDTPGVTDHPFIDNPIMAAGFFEGRLSALGVLGMQVAALFAPLSLSNDYSFNAIPVAILPFGNSTAIWGWSTLAGLAATTFLLWHFRSRLPQSIGFSFGAFLVATLPTSNLLILIGSIRADRFQYLPAAFFWIFVIGASAAVGAACVARFDPDRRARVARFAWWGAGAWISCLALLTHFRCYDWRSNLNLWQSAAVVAGGSTKVQAALGNETVRVKNDEELLRQAIKRTAAAVGVFGEEKVPAADWPLMFFSDLAVFHVKLYDLIVTQPGRQAEALRILDDGIRWVEQGVHYEDEARKRWAERWLAGQEAATPRFGMLHRNHVLLLHRQKRWNEALEKLDEMIAKTPFKDELRDLRAQNLMGQGRYREALDEWTLTLMISPTVQYFIKDMADAVLKLDHEAKPLIPDNSGNQRLNITDPIIIASLKEAYKSYDALLARKGMENERAKLKRSFRYDYGLSP